MEPYHISSVIRNFVFFLSEKGSIKDIFFGRYKIINQLKPVSRC